MLNAQYSSNQIVGITPPNNSILRVPNNQQGQASWSSVAKLILKQPKTKVDPDYWSLTAGENSIHLIVGTDMLRKLKKGFTDISNGHGDYALGQNEDELLYFWWFNK